MINSTCFIDDTDKCVWTQVRVFSSCKADIHVLFKIESAESNQTYIQSSDGVRIYTHVILMCFNWNGVKRFIFAWIVLSS
jgi:hypothetical protein